MSVHPLDDRVDEDACQDDPASPVEDLREFHATAPLLVSLSATNFIVYSYYFTFTRLSRAAFNTTLTEENAMAPAAKIGLILPSIATGIRAAL